MDYTRSSATTNQALDPNSACPFSSHSSRPGALGYAEPDCFCGSDAVPLWHLFFSYFAEYRTGFPFNTINTTKQLIGEPDRLRYPAIFSLNVGARETFSLSGT